MTSTFPLRLCSSFFRPAECPPPSAAPAPGFSPARRDAFTALAAIPLLAPSAARGTRQHPRASAARFVAGILGALAILAVFLVAVHR